MIHRQVFVLACIIMVGVEWRHGRECTQCSARVWKPVSKIVWYGDINVLSRKKEEGNFIRFTDADFAANLLRCLYFREHDALPSQTYLPLEEG